MSRDPRIPAGWPALPFREAEARLTAPGAPFAITTIAIRGVPTRIWEKAPPTLRDLFRIARGHGDRTFVVYRDERVTFTGFSRAAAALVPATVELVPGAPVSDPDSVPLPPGAASAVSAGLSGEVSGDIVLVVSADVVEALNNSPVGRMDVAAALTPVPGGTGPITVSVLAEQTVRAAEARLG